MDDMDTEASFTGNFVTGPEDALFGPYDDVVEKPMEHAIGITPTHGEQITDSGVCSSCHNILLPVLNNDGSPHPVKAPNGQFVNHTYEQTTHLEWVNSDFSKGDTFKSCQDCHMPKSYHNQSLKGTMIANIESDKFAPTDHRLPDDEITLTPRDDYSMHSLHGLNLFMNQMFQQFPVILGIRQIDYMGSTAAKLQPALVTTAKSMTRMARKETAGVYIESVNINQDDVTLAVTVDNWVGHNLPSGVGFRRLFLEVIAEDSNGKAIWASGRTNKLGFILDGTSDNILDTELGENDSTKYQPHYCVVGSGDQVQIYQELIKDSDGILTTSFLRRADPVKDNRLRPDGFNPQQFHTDPSPYIQILSEHEGAVEYDPHYSDPALTGSDKIVYNFKVAPPAASNISRFTARLYSQSTPRSYLQQRFNDAEEGPKAKSNIERLYYLTSHLNTDPETPIQDWKLFVAGDCRTSAGKDCSTEMSDYDLNAPSGSKGTIAATPDDLVGQATRQCKNLQMAKH